MKRWEYEVITVQADNKQNFIQSQITEALNEAGTNGWELVRMELKLLGESEYYECILKREKTYSSHRAVCIN